MPAALVSGSAFSCSHSNGCRRDIASTMWRTHPRKQQNLRKIGDCLLCPKAPSLRRRGQSGLSPIFRPIHSVRRVFISIVARSPASGTLMRAASPPSKTAEPAQNWGLPTLSQGAVFAPPWTERAFPNFSPHPLSPPRFHLHRCPISGQWNTHACRVATLENSRTCAKLGTAYSVPRRRLCAAVDRAGCPQFCAPSTQSAAFSSPSLPDLRAVEHCLDACPGRNGAKSTRNP